MSNQLFSSAWEALPVDSESGITTYRLRVPSGWLVYIEKDSVFTVQFVPDPIGNWTPTDNEELS